MEIFHEMKFSNHHHTINDVRKIQLQAGCRHSSSMNDLHAGMICLQPARLLVQHAASIQKVASDDDEKKSVEKIVVNRNWKDAITNEYMCKLQVKYISDLK
jgi:hypothetical protein